MERKKFMKQIIAVNPNAGWGVGQMDMPLKLLFTHYSSDMVSKKRTAAESIGDAASVQWIKAFDFMTKQYLKNEFDYYVSNISSDLENGFPVRMNKPRVGGRIPVSKQTFFQILEWFNNLYSSGKSPSKIELFWIAVLRTQILGAESILKGYKVEGGDPYHDPSITMRSQFEGFKKEAHDKVIELFIRYYKANKVINLSFPTKDPKTILSDTYFSMVRKVFRSAENSLSIYHDGVKLVPLWSDLKKLFNAEITHFQFTEKYLNILPNADEYRDMGSKPNTRIYYQFLTDVIRKFTEKIDGPMYEGNATLYDKKVGMPLSEGGVLDLPQYYVDSIITSELKKHDPDKAPVYNQDIGRSIFSYVNYDTLVLRRLGPQTSSQWSGAFRTSLWDGIKISAYPIDYFVQLAELSPNNPVQSVKDKASLVVAISTLKSDSELKNLMSNNPSFLTAAKKFVDANEFLVDDGKVNKASLLEFRQVFAKTFPLAFVSQIDSFVSQNPFGNAYYVLGFPLIARLKLLVENIEMKTEPFMNFKESASFGAIRSKANSDFLVYFNNVLASKAIKELGEKYSLSDIAPSSSNFYSSILSARKSASALWSFSDFYGGPKEQTVALRDMIDLLSALAVERNKTTISSNEFALAFNELKKISQSIKKKATNGTLLDPYSSSSNKFYTASLVIMNENLKIIDNMIVSIEGLSLSFDFMIRSLGEATGRFFEEMKVEEYIPEKIIEEIKKIEPVIEVKPEPIVEVKPEPIVEVKPEPVVEVKPQPIQEEVVKNVIQTLVVKREVNESEGVTQVEDETVSPIEDDVVKQTEIDEIDANKLLDSLKKSKKKAQGINKPLALGVGAAALWFILS